MRQSRISKLNPFYTNVYNELKEYYKSKNYIFNTLINKIKEKQNVYY